jgi:hypothetical protein
MFTPFAFVKEEAAVGPPPFEFLLDITPSYPAYSVARKLNSSYSGPALRVQRSGDSTQQDIGFVDNLLDVSDLLSFVGVGTGTVVALYDQNDPDTIAHLNTSSAFPTIVTAGTLITLDSSDSTPTMLCNGTTQFIVTQQSAVQTSYGTVTDNEIMMVGNIVSKPSANAISYVFGNTGFGESPGTENSAAAGTYSRAFGNWGPTTKTGATAATVSIPQNGRALFNVKTDYDVSNGSFVWVNNNNQNYTYGSSAVESTNAKSISIGRYPAGGHYENIKVSEFIMYPLLDSGTTRTDVRTNINNFYSIY